MNQELRGNKIKSFTDFNARKEGYKLTLKIYKITSGLIKKSKFIIHNS